MILKEKAIRIAKRILIKRIEAHKDEDSQCNETETGSSLCSEGNSFLAGFGGLLPEETESIDVECETPEKGTNVVRRRNKDKSKMEECEVQGRLIIFQDILITQH